MNQRVLLGDEAVAMGAIHAGMSAAYAYPGTPSTEILEFLIDWYKHNQAPYATWCANEKTSYECALGASMMGKRALVAMKHVGLNVAADPFMNSALVKINGGLVVVVADDPGLHSSQDEQDSRILADFAKIICFEPTSGQEAYQMTREAYDISEAFHVPVMIRLVTRVAHSRSIIEFQEAKKENTLTMPSAPQDWTLLPSNSRVHWYNLLRQQSDFVSYTEKSSFNKLEINSANKELGVITTGIARNFYYESLADSSLKPSHLHIGAYPIPVGLVTQLTQHVKKIVVIEEGYSYVERLLRGLIPNDQLLVLGKDTDTLPLLGELNTDTVKKALGIPVAKSVKAPDYSAPGRPPQLCKGCPHIDTFKAMKTALADYPTSQVSSDIGCYTLGAFPPYNAIDSCVCMGASIGMAKGAADAGMHPSVAVLGDSTFLHSGITPLLDAVKSNSPMTLVILDNSTTAMTGGQDTLISSAQIKSLVIGCGVNAEHLHIIQAHPKYDQENTQVFKKAIAHKGLSVIIAERECIQTYKAKLKSKDKAE